MVYKVIGLMSGSSLDGLDIAFVQLDEVRGQWSYEILHAECMPYKAEWAQQLQNASKLSVPEYLRLHTAYGRYTGELVNQFIQDKGIEHQVHFIASHGHTVLHEPAQHTTAQIGCGATIAAVTGLPVINDLRALDVALGGQGAPIVPIGDKLLFGQYDYWLNIGGIANITVPHNDGLLAYDLCAANQVLNTLAGKAGKHMDTNGGMAAEGKLLEDVLASLSSQEYYQRTAPKSLSNETAMSLVSPSLLEVAYEVPDALHTAVQHIADEVSKAVQLYPALGKEQATLLITGGGAFNGFLVQRITEALLPLNVSVHIPDETTIKYKEALVMALIGTLRWREETNVMSRVTGASRDSIGGALWMGHSYNG
jgi:anhydro-N-acetylmuramic acid kinase